MLKAAEQDKRRRQPAGAAAPSPSAAPATLAPPAHAPPAHAPPLVAHAPGESGSVLSAQDPPRPIDTDAALMPAGASTPTSTPEAQAHARAALVEATAPKAGKANSSKDSSAGMAEALPRTVQVSFQQRMAFSNGEGSVPPSGSTRCKEPVPAIKKEIAPAFRAETAEPVAVPFIDRLAGSEAGTAESGSPGAMRSAGATECLKGERAQSHASSDLPIKQEQPLPINVPIDEAPNAGETHSELRRSRVDSHSVPQVVTQVERTDTHDGAPLPNLAMALTAFLTSDLGQ